MKIIARYIALGLISATILSSAPVVAKSEPSCLDRYGHFGYSYAYCQHDLYGRSSPPDRFQGQASAPQWRDVGPVAQLESDESVTSVSTRSQPRKSEDTNDEAASETPAYAAGTYPTQYQR